MKVCRYCDGKYEPSPIQTMGKGCSFQCKKDLKDLKKSSNSSRNSKEQLKKHSPEVNEQKKYSSFKSKPRKPLVTKKPLKSSSSLKSTAGLKSSSSLKSSGMQGEAARKIKAEKKQKALNKELITPRLKEVPKYDIDALAAAAKKSCHLYIRTRDKDAVCICCGLPLGDDYHAGHFKESGSNSVIRYDDMNIHAQRRDCNIDWNGDRGYYEKNLRKKIGDFEVNRLIQLASSKEIKRYTAEDYIAIKEKYDAKYEELMLAA